MSNDHHTTGTRRVCGVTAARRVVAPQEPVQFRPDTPSFMNHEHEQRMNNGLWFEYESGTRLDEKAGVMFNGSMVGFQPIRAGSTPVARSMSRTRGTTGDAPVAQLAEQQFCKLPVVGSTPTGGSTFYRKDHHGMGSDYHRLYFTNEARLHVRDCAISRPGRMPTTGTDRASVVAGGGSEIYHGGMCRESGRYLTGRMT